MTAVADRTVGEVADQSAYEVLRDIVRGGLAGTITGLIVAGLGGRLVMRLAAVAVPDSAGRFTENGNKIGQITLEGTAFLVLFGAIIGLVVGTMWVLLSPLIPWTGVRRALATVPLATALGGVGLISGGNPDFLVLGHAPVVVAMLLLLVATVGFVVPLMDDWLDRKLPSVRGASGAILAVYSALAALGGLVTVPALFQALFGTEHPRPLLGLAFVVASGATVAWWVLRSRGHASPPRTLTLVGRAGLLAIAVLGMVDLVPEVGQAVGA